MSSVKNVWNVFDTSFLDQKQIEPITNILKWIKEQYHNVLYFNIILISTGEIIKKYCSKNKM